MNYAFFRGDTPFVKKAAQTSVQKQVANQQTGAQNKQMESTTTSLVVAPKDISFEADGGQHGIMVTTDGTWETPSPSQDWLDIKRVDNKLVVTAKENDSQEERKYTFMITTKDGKFNEQIKISQKGKVAATNGTPPAANYGVVVKDSNGNEIQPGSEVQTGAIVKATVTNPGMSASKFGWKYHLCNGNTKENRKDVTVTITGKPGEIAIFSYGDISTEDGIRERVKLKIIEKTE